MREGDAIVHWVVEGKNTTTPETAGGDLGSYWSEARSIGGIGIAFVVDDTESMTEELAGVQLALQLYIDELANSFQPGEDPPTIQVVSFKDSVFPQIVSKDLDAVRAVVNSLTPAGGTDCPEAGAHAIQFAGASLTSQGILLFATDAAPQPGVDLGTVIAGLEAKGVEVQVILSGDCVDLDSRAGDAGGWLAGASGLAPESRLGGGDQAGSAPPHGYGEHRGLGGAPEEKPGGDDDPAQGPLDDPGQDPLDDHGNTPESATVLVAGAPPTAGHASLSDTDAFALDLQEGVAYALRFEGFGSNPVVMRLYDTDAVTVLRFASTSSTDLIAFVPPATGRYLVRASSLGASYQISFRPDPYPLLLTGQEVYSTLAAETGGVFSLQDGVNAGETTEYVASLLNVMLGTIRPTVILASPNDLPRETTFTVSLTGNRTSWSQDTTVEVLASGVTVEAVEVRSPTRLEVSLSIEAGAPLGFADVRTSTLTGGNLEQALGRDVLEVVDAVAAPTVLSSLPTGAERGETVDFSLFGAGTSWDASSTLDLGAGVAIHSVAAVSPTRIDARVTVDPAAAIAFRTATVATDGRVDDVLKRALFVFGASVEAPRIREVSPPRANRGSRVVAFVETEDADLVPGVATADFGPGVRVVAVDVTTPSLAEVTLEIGVDAPLGARDVTLTSGGRTLVGEDAFFVDDFTSVRHLDAGLARLSESLAPHGSLVFAFEARAGDVLERVFVVPFGDGSNGTVAAPEAEVTLLSPAGQVLWTGRSASAPIDGLALSLPEDGTYRLTVVDRGGAGGAYKGLAFLGQDRAPFTKTPIRSGP